MSTEVQGEFTFLKNKEYVRVVLFVEQTPPALLSSLIRNIEEGAKKTKGVTNTFLQAATVHDAKEAVELINLDPTAQVE